MSFFCDPRRERRHRRLFLDKSMRFTNSFVNSWNRRFNVLIFRVIYSRSIRRNVSSSDISIVINQRTIVTSSKSPIFFATIVSSSLRSPSSFSSFSSFSFLDGILFREEFKNERPADDVIYYRPPQVIPLSD